LDKNNFEEVFANTYKNIEDLLELYKKM
jgi:hypothetical protein